MSQNATSNGTQKFFIIPLGKLQPLPADAELNRVSILLSIRNASVHNVYTVWS